jgi:ferredoxin-type protein NapH
MFAKIRWAILAVSFLLLTFGVYLFGFQIAGWEIPTFACLFNPKVIVNGSCYNLCHLNHWCLECMEPGGILRGAVFIGVNLLFIVCLGRALCGFICPFGFIQDLLDKLRQWLKIGSWRITERNYRWIHFIKWVILAVFLTGTLVECGFCYFCPVMAFLPPLAGKIGALHMSGFIAVLVLAGCFFKRRLWCNVCPLGLLIGLFYKVSAFRLLKDCQACTECGACYEACPMAIKSIYTERLKTDITTYDCLMCGECIKKCPENQALALAVFNKRIFIASREIFFRDQGVTDLKQQRIAQLLDEEKLPDESNQSAKVKG